MEMLTQEIKITRNETINTIYERRAVRKFKPDLVDKKLINAIIDAGRMAPSARNKQPWNFLVLTNKEMIKSLSHETAKVAEKHFPLLFGVNLVTSKDFIFHGAPAVIFLMAPKDSEWAGLDIGMCAQNMMLAAKSFGLDTCPIGLAKFVAQTKTFPQLQIPKEEEIELAIVLGYGDETPDVHKRKKDNVVYLE